MTSSWRYRAGVGVMLGSNQDPYGWRAWAGRGRPMRCGPALALVNPQIP